MSRNRESAGRLLAPGEIRARPDQQKEHGRAECVIQRVKNSGADATAGSVGLSAVPKKSRTWSSAIRIMTMPRRMSIDSIGVGPLRGAVAGPCQRLELRTQDSQLKTHNSKLGHASVLLTSCLGSQTESGTVRSVVRLFTITSVLNWKP